MSFITPSGINVILSGDGSSGSYISSYSIKPGEKNIDVKQKTQGFHFIFTYTKGDETGVWLDFYWSDPDIQNDAKIQVSETNSNSVVIAYRRKLDSLSPLGIPFSYSVPFPSCAEKVWVKITKNGGTPTGTIIVDGEYDSFKQRGTL
jgi:hypothetical protein